MVGLCYIINTAIARALILGAGSRSWACTRHNPRQALAAATRPPARADTNPWGMHSHYCNNKLLQWTEIMCTFLGQICIENLRLGLHASKLQNKANLKMHDNLNLFICPNGS